MSPDEQDDHDLGALGGHVFGQLDAAAAARVEAHLAGCASCRAERDALLPTAAALADLKQARPAAVDTAPPAELGDRIVGTIASTRRRRDRVAYLRSASIAVLGAAAAAAVVVAGVAVLDADDAQAPPQAKIPLESVAVRADDADITASAGIVAHTWGVEVKLTATGFGSGDRYRVDVLGTDGVRHPAGEFVGTGSAPMVCNLNSSVLRNAATGFEVRDRTGRVVAESRFR